MEKTSANNNLQKNRDANLRPEEFPGLDPGLSIDGISGTGAGMRVGNVDLSVWVSVAAIFLVVSFVILPIWFMGVPDGYDLMQHIRFAAAYQDAILSGEFIPKWAANDNFGFGSIGIRYYPPLAYYVLALTKIVTGSWYHSFWITSLAWALLGSAGVYLWIKEWTSGLAATFAAVLYIIIPYHTFQIYQAVLYAEFAAAGILPFCFLFLTRVCRGRRWIDAVLFAISYSLLILTHIPTAIIASLCLAVYGLLIFDWRAFKDTALKLGSALVLSGLATSFHLVKAVTEVEWVKHNSPQYFGSGYYDYKSYFFPIYFSASWTRYVQKMLWHFDTMIFLTILFFVLAVVAYFVNREPEAGSRGKSKNGRAIVTTGVFSLFMLSAGSSVIWNSVPLLAKIQFPWRWLSIASLMGSVSFAIAAASLIFSGKKLNRLAAYPILLFILIIVLFDVSQNIIPSTPLQQDEFEKKVANMYDEEGCQCWWPIWAQSDAFAQPERAVAGSRKAVVSDWSGESRDFSVEAGDVGDLRIATFYHPFWNANVNGEAVPVGKDVNGAILIPLPPETANIHLFFKEPGFLKTALIVSLIVWITFAVYLAGYSIRHRKTRVERT